MNISVVILTFNSEATLANTLAAARQVSDDIHIVDSHSTDETAAIARRYSVNLVEHAFLNYSAQRNWATDHLPINREWELHLDADEQLSEELIAELKDLKRRDDPGIVDGYHIPRLIRFLGRPIRHGGMYPIWHMRLFRRGKGRCERREYDQHFVVSGPTSSLRGPIIDDIRIPLTEWVSRHNRWSDAEVRDLTSVREQPFITPRLFGSPIERKRYFRNYYGRCPGLARAWLLFIYRYFLRLGFLDGKEGAIFFVLQTLWFRFLVDAKLFERNLHSRSTKSPNSFDVHHSTTGESAVRDTKNGSPIL